MLLATSKLLPNTVHSCLPKVCSSRADWSGLELAMFVFLVLSILYPNDTLAYEGHKYLSSCKVVLEAIKFKEKSLPVLKKYFERF